jgi:plastocyanin
MVVLLAGLGLAGPVVIAAKQAASSPPAPATPAEGGTEAVAADEDADSGAAAGGEQTVRMAGLTFTPATISVKSGTQVLFLNDDSAPHTVTADSGDPDSGTLDPGGSFTHVATASFSYICTIHPSMKAQVQVSA